jgi:hypothetical protein
VETADYCREIETYLCRKNDGHLVRVVGPSFETVSKWSDRGIPLKVAYAGIDRYFERYYRQGPRRRPVKIDFCEPDVLDAFDDWRRALGLTAEAAAPQEQPAAARSSSSSLPAHLERVLARLTTARATGRIDAAFDPLIDETSSVLDASRGSGRGVRGDARQAVLRRLASIDDELLALARSALDAAVLERLTRESETELASFRERMAPDAFARAREAALGRLIREHCGLPVVTFA